MEFSERQERTIRAMIDRIIPGDEFASASEAGVLEYIGRQLAGDGRAATERIGYGLEEVEKLALERFATGFDRLEEHEQDEILRGIETVASAESKEFFALLIRLCAEGYYADPGNGGNRDEVAWKMMGYLPEGPGEQT